MNLDFLFEMLEEQYGNALAKKIVQGYNVKRYTTFRVNLLKSNRIEVEEALNAKKIEYEHVKWSKEAYVLKGALEKDIRDLSIYKDGKIYLQSLSSMLPPILLEPEAGLDILDMAAAPGRKNYANSINY